MSGNETETCGVRNATHLMYEGYGGVPENLAINAIAWLILLLLFSFLRRVAWDYGRIALVSRHEEKWTSLFYGDHDSSKLHGSVESLDTQLHAQDRGFCSWVVAFARVKDSDILKKCGKDAIQYLSFQRYLLLYLLVVCVLSTAIIVPVNFTGNNIGNATDFGHTTIANLDPESPLLWIHLILAVLYLVLAVVAMRHFSMNLQYHEGEEGTKTLMISNIPPNKCYKNLLTQHFQEGYPEMSVTDMQFAYDVGQLIDLDKKRSTAAEARINSELELANTGHRPTLRPYPCGQCLCCGEGCGCREVDAINYYTEEENLYRDKCEKEKAKAYQKSLGIAFITFDNEYMAERVMTDFRASCKGAHNPQPSSIHTELDITEWDVMYAPAPENIYWGKLSLSGWKWWMRAILINLSLVILLFFLTTPSVILTSLNQINYQKAVEKLHSPLIVQFFPTLLLWIFTALLPNIVWYSDQYVGHWTRSSEHHSLMRKVFIFLLLMVLILPSLGLTSAKALFEFFIVDQEKNLRWQCIFLSGNGAFFVNYVITSAFIGSALELLRFSELFVYGLQLLLARSSAERTSVRKHVLWEFQYGMQYAWVLCVFATVMSYSIACPLIAPFGLIYMTLKHIVDRYNIYFAYKASHISKHIHSTAINFVIVAVIFLLFNIVFFTVIRGASMDPLSICASIILFITLIIFFGRVSFGWFKNLGPLRYQQPGWIDVETDDKQFGDGEAGRTEDSAATKPFVAGVLQDKKRSDPSLAATATLASSYGTINSPRDADGSRDTAADVQ